METTTRGGCLCGAVRFELRARSKWVAHCHCSMCRRAHGAGYVTWAAWPEAQLTLTSDATLREFASSPEGRRSFCSTCGSPLMFRSTRWPGEVHVALAALEGPVDRAPMFHAYFSDRAPWVEVGDGLRRLGGKSGLEPLP